MTTRTEKAGFLERWFHISARNSSIGTELISGTSTFVSMIYIIPVSAAMYVLAGVDSTAAAISIALVTAIISIIMGLFANLPIALSTGMGLNAFAVFTICLGMGYPYELVMICTFIEGLIFLVLSLTGVRSALANALPHNLKMFIGAGIGGFLAYIGAQNAHIIVKDESTLTTLVSFRDSFSTRGISALLAVVGLAVIAILMVYGMKAAVIIGIALTWVLGMICQATGIYVPDVEAGYYSLYPSLQLPHLTSLSSLTIFNAKSMAVLGNQSIEGGMLINIVVITCTMFYSDFFDTIGTCITCIEKIKTQMTDEAKRIREQYAENKLMLEKAKTIEYEIRELEGERTTKIALLVDAIGTKVGALFMCTTITSFVESCAGIESGGRTGLSAVVTGIWFVIAIFFASVFTAVPGFATGPALIAVGISMLLSALKQVDWANNLMHQIIPGLLCLLFMVLTYNIANGMAIAIIAYVIISLFTKRGKEISPLFYVLAILLICKFAFL